MNEERELDVAEKKAAEPLPHDELGEVLDWDAYIPPPPPKRKGTIRVQIKYKGRAKPTYHPELDDE